MELSPLQSHVKAANLSMDQLAKSTTVSDADKVKEVSRQFEAILLRQILSEAQKTIFPSSLQQEGAVRSIYQDMQVNQLADNISRAGGLGLASTLEKQLSQQLGAKSKPATPSTSAVDEPK